MKTLLVRLCLASTVLAAPASCLAKSPEQTNPWSVLNEITHKHTYMIETRDRKCATGMIRGVTDATLTLDASPRDPRASKRLLFHRADVLRVAADRRIYYSGRSSWTDIKSIRLEGRQRLRVVAITGEIQTVKQPYVVDDDGITLGPPGATRRILKTGIARVYEVIAKPLTDFGEYAIGELGPMIIFDPYFYVYAAHLEPYVPVLLYNGADPQDDLPVECTPK